MLTADHLKRAGLDPRFGHAPGGPIAPGCGRNYDCGYAGLLDRVSYISKDRWTTP